MQESVNSKSMLRVGTILRGMYKIDGYLSSGGFGNTYIATNTVFEETVAIKEFFMKGVTERDETTSVVSVSNADNVQIFEEQREKFKKEARRLRKLSNEHIVKVYDLFDENGTSYYVMDFIDGENLAERLKRTGKPISEKKLRELLPQILDALKTVHQIGFCHLDLKPSNIMLEKSGLIKLIDFGASKQLGANGTLNTNDSTSLAQTPGFAPREQMEQNFAKIGPWTDIYALGATLYNLLTKNLPPLPTNIDDDETEDKHNVLSFPSTTSEDIKQLVLRMMNTNRTKRPQSIDDISISIEKTKHRGSKSKCSNNPQFVMPFPEPPTKLDPKDGPIGDETVLEDSGETIIEYNPTKEDQLRSTTGEMVLASLPRPGIITSIKEGLHEKFCYDLGRSRRSEFWWFVLFCVIATPFVSILSQSIGIFQLLYIYLFAALLFAFTRRLHDSGHSGYWCLVFLVPFTPMLLLFFPNIPAWVFRIPLLVSIVIIMYLGCLDSEKGENEYGESPKYVFVEKKELEQDHEEESWLDRLSGFLSKKNNIVILIIPVAVAFLAYFLWGGDGKDGKNSKTGIQPSKENVAQPESVDLGLSVEWATFNVGATKPYEIGNYYWWASTNPLANEDDVQNVYDMDETGQAFIKYNEEGMLMASDDDAAKKEWGKKWRTPTPDELYELATNCTWEEVDNMGMKGYNVKGKNGNKIFLPYSFNPDNAYLMGLYMSNAMSSNNVAYFLALLFSDKNLKEIGIADEKDKITVMEIARTSFAVIRPVKDKDDVVEEGADPIDTPEEKIIDNKKKDSHEKIYDSVETMPSFPGGTSALISWLNQNINYPSIAANNGVQGRVQVQFVVETDGSISNVELVNKVEPSLDKEAVRVVNNMPHWIPGKLKSGARVRVKYTIPITFKLK